MTIDESMEQEGAFVAGTYDVAVVGAGHAGCEAAHACAVIGLKTILFTLSLDSLANLPCNPSIGGTSKGQLVRELDALGGIMGKVADSCAVQMRMLNRSKGPAVYSPRAQMDRAMYSVTMKHSLENLPGLTLRQDHIVRLLTDSEGRAAGVMTAGKAVYGAKAIVICSGTYMESRTIKGEVITESGPDGLPRSTGLSGCLKELGIPILRFKTGTPVRVNSKTCDFTAMTRQNGEGDVPPFSFENEMNGSYPKPAGEQLPCWSVWTTDETREIITENMSRSPLYSGVIKGIGPRYCPSIEDKFMRFKDKPRHQIFVEPMGTHTNEMYLQGFSTSLPEEIQIKMVRSLPGLHDAVVQRSAYAIEYDLVDPLQCKASLESKIVPNLFTAGQINGSSGYEEAAAQGIIAGINAAMKVLGKPPLIVDRSSGYIGVLIDDLVTKGTNEPYRMMTARAEYRLFLRQDNADMRLTEKGHEIGLVKEDRYERYLNKKAAVEKEIERLKTERVTPKEVNHLLTEIGGSEIKVGLSLYEFLKRPEVTYDILEQIGKGAGEEVADDVKEQCVIMSKYEGYIDKQLKQIDQFKKLENRKLPEDINYSTIEGLRLEARKKLDAIKPVSIGQASRISGVSPADISVLLIYLEQMRKTRGGNNE